MPSYVARADLPYTPQQVFDLVADVECYPKFLRHVVSARIRRRDGNTLWVDQVVQFKLLRMPFSTRAVLHPPSEIHVFCSGSLFGTLDERWSFAGVPSGGTHLSCRTDYQFRSGLLRIVLEPALSEVLRTTVKAFESRARQLYGSVTPSV